MGTAIVFTLAIGLAPNTAYPLELVLVASGVAAVAVLFTIPYVRAHAMNDLLRGVIFRAQHRFQLQGTWAPGPDLLWMGFAVPLAYAVAPREGANNARTSSVWTLVVFWIAANLPR
jgi:hypothetical protein